MVAVTNAAPESPGNDDPPIVGVPGAAPQLQTKERSTFARPGAHNYRQNERGFDPNDRTHH